MRLPQWQPQWQRGRRLQRIEIVGDRRRAYDAAFRDEVVAASGAAGARVREVAGGTGSVRACCIAGDDGGRANMGMARARLFPSGSPAVRDRRHRRKGRRVSAPRRAGLIEIELAGGVRVRVDEAVSVAALRRVLAVLRGR